MHDIGQFGTDCLSCVRFGCIIAHAISFHARTHQKAIRFPKAQYPTVRVLVSREKLIWGAPRACSAPQDAHMDVVELRDFCGMLKKSEKRESVSSIKAPCVPATLLLVSVPWVSIRH